MLPIVLSPVKTRSGIQYGDYSYHHSMTCVGKFRSCHKWCSEWFEVLLKGQADWRHSALFQLVFKVLQIQKTHLMPAYTLFVLTKDLHQIIFNKRSLEKLKAVCLIPFIFRETAITTEDVVLPILKSGCSWK